MENIVNQIVKHIGLVNPYDYAILYISEYGMSKTRSANCTPILIIKIKGCKQSEYVLNLTNCKPTQKSKIQIEISREILLQIKELNGVY